MDNGRGTRADSSHAQAELTRIDLLLRREVRRWQLAGQDPHDALRGLYVSDGEVQALLERPLGGNWGQTIALPPEETAQFTRSMMAVQEATRRELELAQEQGITPPLVHLSQAFGLKPIEMEILLLCLAPAFDLRYERIYSYLQDDVTKRLPTVNLVLNLLAREPAERAGLLDYLADSAPLIRHGLIRRSGAAPPSGSSLLTQSLAIDETLVFWLMGHYQPEGALRGRAALVLPSAVRDAALVSDEMATQLDAWDEDSPIFVFTGPDHARQDTAARYLAARRGRPLLAVSLVELGDEAGALRRVVTLALRDARITDAVPFLYGWDAALAEGVPPPDLLAELCAYPERVIIAGSNTWNPKGIDRTRTMRWMAFPLPTFPERLALWAHYLGGPEASDGGPDLVALAGQFTLTAGQIRDAAATARDIASQNGATLREEDLFAAARAHSNLRLSSLARKITPRYGWHDIILPGDQLALLQEIINTVRGRPQVLDGWGLGRKLASSRGVTILFAGPPGTGKTMAAEIIAGDLGLDLYKIDLSTVVSKYIGETEKNIERIFREAEQSNAILFFDEADALFGKRSEVRDSHDRYANIEISYLLQRMEAYDGVTILATNLRANLDEAFTRRLQFAVNFPFPEAEDRQRIWETLFPREVPRSEEIDFRLLAERFRLSGGSIRNIIVGAAYLAATDGGTVTLGHMLHSTRRELQKMGRLISEEDLITS